MGRFLLRALIAKGFVGLPEKPVPEPAPRRRMLLERLEDRLLFDAGPVAPVDVDAELAQQAQAAQEAMPMDGSVLEPADVRIIETLDQIDASLTDLLGQPLDDASSLTLDPNETANEGTGDPSLLNSEELAQQLLTTADEQSTELHAATADIRHEIAFVDSTIRNLSELLAGISPDVEVVLFDSTRDGVEQIAERLADRTGLDAIHILSHGSDATAQLGTATLNAATIQGQYAELLQRIGQSLADGGDLLMYGCNFGAGPEGRLATEALARVTGADVATSTNATGHASRGGDWELEQQIGWVESAVVVSLSTQVEWVGLLPTTIARTSTPVFYIDLVDSQDSAYASYQITNDDGVNYSDVWVTIGSFTGGVVSANVNEDRVMHLGALNNGATKAAFFYLTASGITDVDQGHTINVYSGLPGTGSLISSQSFVFTDVVSTIAANANKVTTVVSGPNPAELGGIMTITVTGETGTIGAAEVMAFTPATYSNWRADAFELIGTTITLSAPNAGTFTDTLLIPPAALTSGANTPYVNVYTFKAVGTTAGPTAVSPVGYISSGTQVKHTGTGGFLDGSFPPIQPPQNTTTLSKLSNIDGLHDGGNITYTLRLTNSGSTPVSMEQLVDTLPGAVSYVAGSTTFNGSAFADPIISGQQLTWAGTFTVAAGSTADLVFTATLPNINAVYVNQAVAWIGSIQIDTTLDTTDNAPATKSVTVGNQIPIAVDDGYTFTEEVTLNVSVPGVKGNDSDGDGDTLTVSILSGPANGSLTLNSNGSFSFTPNANFSGSDTFVYEISDGYGGTDSATVTLTGTPVNDPPAGSDTSRTINEDTVSIFAATDFGFSDPNDVPANAFLEVVISTLPPPAEGVLMLDGVPVTTNQAIQMTEIGNLTFTPAANLTGNGLGLFTFQVRDDGGGLNTDPTPNTFHFDITAINDPPTSGDQSVTTTEDTNYVFALSDFPYSDAEGDALADIRIDSLPAAGTLLLNGTPVVSGQIIDPANIDAGLLVFQPPPDLYGSPATTFTFSVGDGLDFSTLPTTMMINITPVVDITADSLITSEDTPITFNPITGTNGATADSFESTSPTITAINGTAISVGDSVTVTNGTVSLAAGNLLTFTPAADFNGTVPPSSTRSRRAEPPKRPTSMSPSHRSPIHQSPTTRPSLSPKTTR